MTPATRSVDSFSPAGATRRSTTRTRTPFSWSRPSATAPTRRAAVARTPSYPAALPARARRRGLRRSATCRTSRTATRLRRPRRARGQDILSTFPRLADAAVLGLQRNRATRAAGPRSTAIADGTSFAAPQVTAAAACCSALDPSLRPDQVAALLERSADDATPADRLRRLHCRPGRSDRQGRLDVAAALDPLARAASRAGPLRAERRHRPRGQAVYGRSLHRPGDARPLGRPERRLRHPAPPGPGAVRVPRRSTRRSRTSLVLWKPGLQSLTARPRGARELALERTRQVSGQQRSSTAPGDRARTTSRSTLGGKPRRAAATRSRCTRKRPARPAARPRAPRGSAAPDCRPRARAAGRPSCTTAPAPTNASSPISIAGQSTAPPPIRAPRRIVGPLISSWRRSVRPMKLSFVVTTHGAMKTCSSSVE